MNISTALRITRWFAVSKLASLIKVSFIVGSHAAFFSGIALFNPLIGAFNSRTATLLIFGALAALKLVITGSLDAHFLAYIIPGACAALYWNTSPLLMRIMVPILCMAAFVAHPVGFAAAPYALFWFIPIAFYFIRHTNIFLHALSSTFIAHAVGSVIWLYTVPMVASTWIGLMPIVCLERLTFAFGIVLGYRVLSALKSYMAQSNAQANPLLRNA